MKRTTMRLALHRIPMALVLPTLFAATAARAVEIRFERVADGVYAFIG